MSWLGREHAAARRRIAAKRVYRRAIERSCGAGTKDWAWAMVFDTSIRATFGERSTMAAPPAAITSAPKR